MDSNLPTTFYSNTWHDTRDNALKCPPCKRVVLAEEAAEAKAAEERARQARNDPRKAGYIIPGAIINLTNPVQWQVEQQQAAIQQRLRHWGAIDAALGMGLAPPRSK